MVRDSLVGIDTNIFIYYYQSHPKFGPTTQKIFTSLALNKTRAVTSVITLIELLSLTTTSEIAKQLQSLYFETPNLVTLEVNQEIALEAARIRREYSYRLPDAIQLATAKSAKASRFITNDKRLKSFKELKIQFPF